MSCIPSCPFITYEKALEMEWLTDFDNYVGNYNVSLRALFPNHESPYVYFGLNLTSQCADNETSIRDEEIPVIYYTLGDGHAVYSF